jgi:hypothetical protein
MMEYHCPECGLNLYKGSCQSKKCTNSNRFHIKCGRCGKMFHCAGKARGCGGCSGATGPCCSKPPNVNEDCWKGMPYYDDWIAGRIYER